MKHGGRTRSCYVPAPQRRLRGGGQAPRVLHFNGTASRDPVNADGHQARRQRLRTTFRSEEIDWSLRRPQHEAARHLQEVKVENSLEILQLPGADLARWQTAGRRLAPLTTAVLVEVSGLRSEPSKQRIGRAANAARYAASIADEPLRTEAVTLAEELERRSV